MNILLTMWGANAAAPLNTVQIGYGVGAVLVNLLVRSFLTNKISSTNVIDNQKVISTLTSINTKKYNSNIIIPYSIAAVLCLLIAAGYVFFYIQELKSRKHTLEIQEVKRKISFKKKKELYQ